MKVIFLDIDGVLNNTLNCKAFIRGGLLLGIERKYVRLLARIVDETGAELVLSSDWKMGWKPGRRSTEQPSVAGRYLQNKLMKDGLMLLDKTDDNTYGRRGAEIDAWLKSHPDVTDYVILDDTVFADFTPEQIKRLILTDCRYGLTPFNAEDAIKILNGQLVAKGVSDEDLT